MKTFQTQCSNCHHVFTISDSQLAFKNGLARCGHCKQIFSAKDNLVKTAPLTERQKAALAELQAQKAQPAISPTAVSSTPPQSSPSTSLPTSLSTSSPAPSQSLSPTASSTAISDPALATNLAVEPVLTKKQKRAKTGEGLISDDLLMDDPLDGDSNTTASTSQPSSTGFEFDILEDFDVQPNKKPVNFHDTTDSNNDKLAVNGDESWVEQMMVEEQIKERDKSFLADARNNPVGAKESVTDLLDDLGVDVVPETALSQEAYLQKMSQRLEHTTSSQQTYQKTSLLTPVLWGLGCLLLLGLLAVQYVVFNVNDLMKDKSHAQTLTSLCQTTHLPCNLAQADLASVDIKTLSVANNGGKADVLFTLTNKSSQPVLYPNLKISLQKNNSGVAHLVLSPQQYLDEAAEQMAPQQIKPIKLRLDIARDKFDQAVIESFY